MQPEDLFSTDYLTARERFRRAAGSAGADLTALPLAARGPEGHQLTIDIACFGVQPARRVLLHTSGLHGVEAFAGSAVQLAALAQLPAPPAQCALVLVHTLNPYGMAWLRRVNENNVDLNRNFLRENEHFEVGSPIYDRLDALLNPPSPPANDFFRLRLAALALRYGPRSLTQAIAQGQYGYPQGLFYGGNALQPGPAVYLDWLSRRLQETDYLMAVDLHTGLGEWGQAVQFMEHGVGATPARDLSIQLKPFVIEPARDAARPYRTRGGMGGALPRALPRSRIDFILQEIGTDGPLAVLRALRNENRWHHYGARSSGESVKRALLESFCPASTTWRRQAVATGLGLVHAAAAWTFRPN